MLKTKNWKAETPALMQELIVVDEITDFTSMNIEIIVKDWMTKMKLEWVK
jgi:glutamyl-tRNA synthetase